jgi:hypothetical protein
MTTPKSRALTPASALAGILNQIVMVLSADGLDAAQRLAQIAAAEQLARPAVGRFLEQERITRDIDTIATAIERGAQVRYSADMGQPARITVVLDAAQEAQSEIFESVRQIANFERELRETGQVIAYEWSDARGEFVPAVVTRDPEAGPLTDEEVAIMLRVGWPSQ